MLTSLGYNYEIEAYVVFINPEFTLYNAPSNLPIILPTQVNRFLKKLDSKPSRLNISHKNLATSLASLHKTSSPYAKIQLPSYEYHQLKKGGTCCNCHSFSVSVRGMKLVCDTCGCEEKAEVFIMRSVGELKLLFPEMKITTNLIYEWCQVFKCKKRVRRVLVKNLNMIGVHQWAFYE